MQPVHQQENCAVGEHLQQAHRLLSLPVEASLLRWHPFGVYTAPLAPRTESGERWSRRLHLWHPAGKPVGEASPYGVHTHSGIARSHVLVGSLHHHLYEFAADAAGDWNRACLGKPEGTARLLGHMQATTRAGTTHTLPKDHPHGVTKPPGFAISLFEQLDGPTDQPFTTWQRNDVEAEPLVRAAPVPVDDVRREALILINQAIVQPASSA